MSVQRRNKPPTVRSFWRRQRRQGLTWVQVTSSLGQQRQAKDEDRRGIDQRPGMGTGRACVWMQLRGLTRYHADCHVQRRPRHVWLPAGRQRRTWHRRTCPRRRWLGWRNTEPGNVVAATAAGTSRRHVERKYGTCARF